MGGGCLPFMRSATFLRFCIPPPAYDFATHATYQFHVFATTLPLGVALSDLPPGPLAEADEEGGVEEAEDPAEAGGDAHGVGEGVPGRPLQACQRVVVAVQRALRLGQRHARRAGRGRLRGGGNRNI